MRQACGPSLGPITMGRDTGTRLTRRGVLKAAGIAVGGSLAASRSAAAAQEDANVSVTFEGQESDGASVVIASLRTDVDAEVIVFESEGDRTRYRVLEVEAGTEFTDRTVELTTSIPQSQLISVSVQPPDGGYSYGGARATVAVGEPLRQARASIPNGELELVTADPQAGFEHPYLLYRPETTQRTARPLFVEPHNSAPADSREELLSQLYRRAESYLRPAISLSLPGLIPGFPRTPEDGGDYVQSLGLELLDTQGKRQEVATDAFPAETLHRVDQQLLRMLEDARDRLAEEPYAVDEGIHMDGFSASGTFSSRFAFLHPTRVNSFSAGGGGAAPLPFSSRDGYTLPYPLGTADYREWTGRSFDRDAWTAIDQYIYVGAEDQPLPDTDRRGYYPISNRYQDTAEAVYGENRVTERLPVTRSVYDEAGANAEFVTYDGVGHRITPEMRRDTAAFHRRTSDAQHALFEVALRRSADRIAVGTPLTVTVEVRNRVSEAATVTPTFYVDDAEVGTAERDVEPNGSTELSFEYTFDEPGSYALSIDGRQVGEGPLTVTEPTPTPTATSTPSDQPSTSPATGTTETTGPGFGIGAALAGIAGLSYVLNRDNDD